MRCCKREYVTPLKPVLAFRDQSAPPDMCEPDGLSTTVPAVRRGHVFLEARRSNTGCRLDGAVSIVGAVDRYNDRASSRETMRCSE